jgi:hypothetical protein
MTRREYTYTTLRYVHDTLTGEFVNVGVILYAPGDTQAPVAFKAATRKTIGRMRDMFPDLDRSAFLSAMRTIDRGASRLQAQLGREGMITSTGDAVAMAKKLLPADDSSLQWGPVGSGSTDNTQKAFEKLFSRFVTRYDEKPVSRRSDEEVWRPVRLELEQRKLPVQLEKKTIAGGDDKIDFSHAWKNGAWHAYEAVSLDLADADGIYKKAHRWLGQLTSVAPEAQEAFRAYLIVGAPSDPSLHSAYEKALRIMSKSPDTEVFEETQVNELVDMIEDEVRAHLVA